MTLNALSDFATRVNFVRLRLQCLRGFSAFGAMHYLSIKTGMSDRFAQGRGARVTSRNILTHYLVTYWVRLLSTTYSQLARRISTFTFSDRLTPKTWSCALWSSSSFCILPVVVVRRYTVVTCKIKRLLFFANVLQMFYFTCNALSSTLVQHAKTFAKMFCNIFANVSA